MQAIQAWIPTTTTTTPQPQVAWGSPGATTPTVFVVGAPTMPQAMTTMPAWQNTSPPVIVVQAEVGIVGWKPRMAKYGEGAFVEAPRAPMVEAEPYDPTEVHQQGQHDEEKGGVPRRRNQVEWKAVPG
ncbi:unnamed protein product [Heligmosomoides polygyrus]|uniref:Secreted protein n=1 Tax=Heligmosomoides polygyrus TaxID=6339 RepID=A0A183FSS9_HELPZ|nr:unnamed protein product [Heligmosomoides polygyrus]